MAESLDLLLSQVSICDGDSESRFYRLDAAPEEVRAVGKTTEFDSIYLFILLLIATRVVSNLELCNRISITILSFFHGENALPEGRADSRNSLPSTLTGEQKHC